ncbi:DUF4380 domain-containing protein [Lewinella sp. IMCC34191]|uniref:DUF4380 domain-containing protein n=1 Tax=Lewinella sp. IMCC34191 TaxID=2259172 RepID=UPI000E23A2A5|nr:DUF4380 domain-containing protein [Lewinella sp. IMCC34191]
MMKAYTSYFSVLLLAFTVCACNPDKADAEGEDVITLTRDSLTIQVDPRLGGRLVSLQYAGQEVLPTTRDSSGFQFGSTAWPAPQADWSWPPPATLDREPYSVQKVEDHSVLLISKQDPKTGLVLQKRYRLGPNSDIGLTYWLTNKGDSIRSVGAWEVTRLPYGGEFSFYSDSLRVERGSAETVQSQDSLRRITVDDRHEGKVKVFADLDSIPAVYTHDGIRLEKHTVVSDYYRVAPGQAPLEIYLDQEAGFIEFELHGDYRRLGYDETSTLRTKWVVGRE